MKGIILSILLALCSMTLVASDAAMDKPEFVAKRVFKPGGGSCAISTALYLDDVCYCSDAGPLNKSAFETDANTFCKFDAIAILGTDDENAKAHKRGVIDIQDQVKRFFERARAEAREIFSSPSEENINDYINRRFDELFKVTLDLDF